MSPNASSSQSKCQSLQKLSKHYYEFSVNIKYQIILSYRHINYSIASPATFSKALPLTKPFAIPNNDTAPEAEITSFAKPAIITESSLFIFLQIGNLTSSCKHMKPFSANLFSCFRIISANPENNTFQLTYFTEFLKELCWNYEKKARREGT